MIQQHGLYGARVLADSYSPDGVRLTTLEATFPRFILAEMNTHRVFSRNSASSRAIPPEKQIERVQTNPFIPETFNRRVKGMGVGEALSDYAAQEECVYAWLSARDHAVNAAQALLFHDVDKSRINRLLEPFMWHTAIISATEWDNFFALRCPDGDEPDINFPAQLEMQQIAILMRDVMAASEPQILDYGQWHLPLITQEELARLCEVRKRDAELGRSDSIDIEKFKLVSARRCARVSFDKHTDTEPWETSAERAEALMVAGHLSPFEHVARPLGEEDDEGIPEGTFVGNFRGWVQFRKEIPYEANHDLAATRA